ncbi:hypothetical protein RhiXN_02402 [Rhizoctonia solani]|uniref:Uncharacterized protein n=1 Tax=Rhizoctonia solani TaxID=456999 RepID=A0A8H8T4M0_9AGAM|nr:uncharacterized protein RhiXN_02402 [Rhizoctonia solani]QRW27807.1 hypothetical protein RhiXN_02402 [Rhizoctonia solani]
MPKDTVDAIANTPFVAREMGKLIEDTEGQQMDLQTSMYQLAKACTEMPLGSDFAVTWLAGLIAHLKTHVPSDDLLANSQEDWQWSPWAKFTVCWTGSGSIMLNLDNLPVIIYWKTLRKIGGGHPWAKFTVHWTVSGSIMLN